MDKITLRPSSVDTFFTCPYQWYSVFILGKHTIPSARAAIGTAIHAGVETLWTEAILSSKIDDNREKLTDAAIASYQEQHQAGLEYDQGEDQTTAEAAVVQGVHTFCDDIVPFTAIPLHVEKRLTIKIDNPIVQAISGTIDYISSDTIADVKTSRRKPVASSYTTQQSVYKFLAEKNGYNVQHNVIQGVVLKTRPEGHIIKLEPKVDRARHLLNTMLETLRAYHEDKVSPEILFRGNNKHYLCSPKYCTLYGKECKYTQG